MKEFIEQIFLMAAFDVPVSAAPIVIRCDAKVAHHSSGLVAISQCRPITEQDFYDWRGELAQEAGWL